MRYIDLSQKIDNGIPVYPGDSEVSLVQERNLLKHDYNAYTFSTGLHAGSHIDCPMHLLEDSRTIAQYPLECFAGSGCLINAYGENSIGYKDIYENIVQKGDIVLVYTGADEYYGSERYYNEHPVITYDFADFLVSREIKMLGVDMPSPDFYPFQIHKHLLSHDIFIIENLTNLQQLSGINYFEVFAEPLKIHAEASLTRAFARYA
jgi:kynurenine formamidase